MRMYSTCTICKSAFHIRTLGSSSNPFSSQAVIKEAMRLAPTNNLPLERIVPQEEFVINGYKVPAGTIVGTSAYVVHRDKGIYGSDADNFRPERWLDSDQSVLRQMQNHFFAVGIASYSLHPPPSWWICPGDTQCDLVRSRRARLQRPHTGDDDDGIVHRSCTPGFRC